jgi:hypothetical protein
LSKNDYVFTLSIFAVNENGVIASPSNSSECSGFTSTCTDIRALPPKAGLEQPVEWLISRGLHDSGIEEPWRAVLHCLCKIFETLLCAQFQAFQIQNPKSHRYGET